MEPYIKNAEELIELFRHYIRFKKGKNTIAISSEIRKEILISENQGFVVVNGKFHKIKFENIEGGVWIASIESNDDPRLKFLKEKK